jgi:pyroglutamyl-peptidase
MTRTILATGFSVFPGAPENPTAWVMAELERTGWQPAGARLVTRTLPVRFDMWERGYQPLLAEFKPDVAIAFGLSAKAKGMTLESTARNRVATDRPDFTGVCSPGDCVKTDGPAVRPTRLPLRDISVALRKADVPVARSDDAGDYMCNLLFYRLMEHAEAGEPAIAGFIHVPYLDSQARRLIANGAIADGVFTLSEAQLLRGVQTIIQVCVAASAQMTQR